MGEEGFEGLKERGKERRHRSPTILIIHFLSSFLSFIRATPTPSPSAMQSPEATRASPVARAQAHARPKQARPLTLACSGRCVAEEAKGRHLICKAPCHGLGMAQVPSSLHLTARCSTLSFPTALCRALQLRWHGGPQHVARATVRGSRRRKAAGARAFPLRQLRQEQGDDALCGRE